MDVLTWGQFGLAGLIAMTLGGVIAYVFKLFVTSQAATIIRIIADRDREHAEKIELNKYIQERQREIVITLSDVARVMAEVQRMLQERDYERRRDQRGGQRD